MLAPTMITLLFIPTIYTIIEERVLRKRSNPTNPSPKACPNRSNRLARIRQTQ
ncbi:MAG: hypothetical protein SF097_26060 [Acidobacteriota bacterium]|nr:hypothetical protein [Acidobacteriota bacterium]